MQDTSDEFLAYHRSRVAQLSYPERLLRALHMFDHGREVMRAGIRHDHPELTDGEVEQRLFLRMYGDELPPAIVQRALNRIARLAGRRQRPGGFLTTRLAAHFVSCVH